ncbi:MAG: hypothetical protein ABFR75_14200 [Acidobacteriota bacterium]
MSKAGIAGVIKKQRLCHLWSLGKMVRGKRLEVRGNKALGYRPQVAGDLSELKLGCRLQEAGDLPAESCGLKADS